MLLGFNQNVKQSVRQLQSVPAICTPRFLHIHDLRRPRKGQGRGHGVVVFYTLLDDKTNLIEKSINWNAKPNTTLIQGRENRRCCCDVISVVFTAEIHWARSKKRQLALLFSDSLLSCVHGRFQLISLHCPVRGQFDLHCIVCFLFCFRNGYRKLFFNRRIVILLHYLFVFFLLASILYICSGSQDSHIF